MSPATAPQQTSQAPPRPAGTTTAPAVAGVKSATPPPAATAPGVKVDAATQAAVEQKGGKLAGLKGMSAGALGKMKGVSKLPKKTLMIIGIIAIVVVVAVVVVAVGGGDKKPSGGGGIDVAKLDDWSGDLDPITLNLVEGTPDVPNSVSFDLADLLAENATGVYFITNIEASLTWQDEADQRWMGRTRVNRPDSFQLEINTSVNASAKSEVKANDVSSKQGSVSLSFAVSGSEYTYIVAGNSTDLELPPEATMGAVTVVVYLYEAQDLYASGPAAFKLNDPGNDFTLTIKVRGKVYNP